MYRSEGSGLLHVSRHQGLLGTVVECRIHAETASAAHGCESEIVTEIARLQHVLSSFDESSELCRWQRGDIDPGPELSQVLALAAKWQERSDGAFSVSTGVLTDLWTRAAQMDALPTSEALREAARRCVAVPYKIENSAVGRPDGPRTVDLNAIAKGWIMDRAASVAFACPGVTDLMINAGGDLVHRGPLGVSVGIEDPARPFDNVLPLAVVRVQDAALATSGVNRRGWHIDGRWYGHVLDPRTGWPADAVASASVIADDAATADAVATILTVLGAEEGLVFVDALDGIDCFMVRDDGALVCTDAWGAVAIS